MKKIVIILICLFIMVGCTNSGVNSNVNSYEDAINIILSDSGIKVDGETISTDFSDAVYLANDIVYYVEGKDGSYGEGSESDSHSVEEAESHSVVHITKAGMYRLSGTLSKGQVAIDLGEDAEDDSNAIVTLVLDGVDITCEVAPAIIFYNVYESESTEKAGANVVIVDGSTNTVNGSYVAKIFKEGTEKKLHKYDGAFYSKQSMIVNGNTGVLNINATNEGLDTEMHLTINGGSINIVAQNDGINVNEDGVSIFTMNNGLLTVDSGYGEEGDGIDSNGSLIINGGTVIAMPCNRSADGGIDADLGITINGGTVIAFGMNGSINDESSQNYVSGTVNSSTVIVKEKNDVLYELETPRKYSSGLFSSSAIKEDGSYSINDNTATINSDSGFGFPGGNMGGFNGKFPNGEFDPNNIPEGMQRPNANFDPNNMPEGFDPSQRPNGVWGNFDPNNMPEGMQRPEGNFDPSKMPNGNFDPNELDKNNNV